LSFKFILFFVVISTNYVLAGNTDSLRADFTYEDSWFAPDKGRHLIGSMVTTIFLTKIGERDWNMRSGDSRLMGVTITLSLGIGKEFIDQKNPRNIFSFRDLTADITGIVLGLLILEID
jgi:uncharacterized protein YfiM (DUF2279 family)